MSKNLSPCAENSVKTARRGNPDKLIPHRWQPGQSGNPGGRPKKKPITEIYEELLAEGVTRNDIKKTMRALVRKKNGLAVQALREMADRIEGRAAGIESVEMSGLEGLAEAIQEGRKRAASPEEPEAS
jgi:hypothetical protein